MFKDSSTNKGAVTSSSYEILAGMAFDDAEFAEHMIPNEKGEYSLFYKEYVEDIIAKVESNARNEFEILW